MNYEVLVILIFLPSLWLLEILCRSVNSGSHVHLFLETLAHGLTGSMFWIFCLTSINGKLDLSTGYRKNVMILESCFWAAFGAVLPDIDHFIAARSISIELALQLPGRPFLHWAGLYALIYAILTISLFLLSYPSCCITLNKFWAIFWCLIFIPFVSHITRDANKRGFWLWPPPDIHTWMSTSNFMYSVTLDNNLGIITAIRIPLFYIVTLCFVVLLFRCYAHYLHWNRWIARQRSDPYVKHARLESYRCRSAFKLLQLNEKIYGGLFKPGDIVIDCGAAPGSWCQVASSLINSNDNNSNNQGLIIAFDLLNFAQLPGVIIHSGIDLNNWSECINLINQSISNHFINNNNRQLQDIQKLLPAVDVVLSDIAPNVTISVSKQGASFVIKLFESPEAEEFKQTVSQFYTFNSSKYSSFTRFIKPAASRKESSEIYLVARGFKLP
ncbi:rRNA methyltransferase 2, mitochondrial [Schistosoma japonicum]|nr:rRNA methyltransferase 2, mitochondrial [Schistosoma japonicum]